MSTPTDVTDLELREVAHMVATREISPVELTNAYLDRIATRDPHLHSYVRVTAELAMSQARQAEHDIARGNPLGPLHGVPLAVKDVVDIEGEPTAAGMPMHADRLATDSATVARRLSNAGAVMLGKHVLTEGVYAEHRAPYRTPVNPWGSERWSGASSSGSGVAVAAGLCAGALGSDTGASIRLPSAVNGVTGIRPTHGRVSRHGVFELAATLDQVGPITRSVADAATLLRAIAGRDPADPTTSVRPPPDYLAEPAEIDGLRLGLDPAFALTDVDADTEATVRDVVSTLRTLGAELREIRLPETTQIVQDWYGVCAVQAALAHRDWFPSRREEYGPALRELLELGNGMSAVEHHELLLRRANFRGELEQVFTDVDLLITPALAFRTPTTEEMTRMDERLISGIHRFTCPFPMSGNPVVTFPAGYTEDGLPIGVQLVAGHLREDLLIRAGRAFQATTDWHRQRPPT